MTAQDQMRKMLDQLMGQDRDGKTCGLRFLARFFSNVFLEIKLCQKVGVQPVVYVTM